MSIRLPSGLYHKLHGVPRPVAMKKTVIKRRKRVPAVGAATGRGGSAAGEQSSPAHPSVPIPATTPQTATPADDKTTTHTTHAAAADHRPAGLSDPLGLRRAPAPSASKAVPLIIGSATQRRPGWWLEDQRGRAKEPVAATADRDGKENKDKEGVSPNSMIGPVHMPTCPFPTSRLDAFPFFTSRRQR